jgi:predicted DNA-binding protein
MPSKRPPRSVRLPAALDARLAAWAAAQGRPVNAVIAEAVEAYLTTREEDQAPPQ